MTNCVSAGRQYLVAVEIFVCSNLNSAAVNNKSSVYKNSPGLDSTNNNIIKMRDLVLSSMPWVVCENDSASLV